MHTMTKSVKLFTFNFIPPRFSDQPKDMALFWNTPRSTSLSP